MIEANTEQDIGRRWMPFEQQHLSQMAGQLQLAFVQIGLQSSCRDMPYSDLWVHLNGNRQIFVIIN